ncbi:MAG TPA: response regulator [Anaeromyxobacteraceae bacterium]|nr:response regulator [Anaeromyxobacteraceae bacterium]
MTEKVILLVEDNPDDEALMIRAFQRSKLANRIDVARDGAEALAYLVGPSARPMPTLVILDLKLPKVDGLEVLRRLRAEERTRTLPVVVLTSSREEQDLVESYRLGANSYVRKPVDFIQFADATQTLGLYWLVVNEPPPQKDRA